MGNSRLKKLFSGLIGERELTTYHIEEFNRLEREIENSEGEVRVEAMRNYISLVEYLRGMYFLGKYDEKARKFKEELNALSRK